MHCWAAYLIGDFLQMCRDDLLFWAMVYWCSSEETAAPAVRYISMTGLVCGL
jgi:hypothetical protein